MASRPCILMRFPGADVVKLRGDRVFDIRAMLPFELRPKIRIMVR